MENEKLMKEVFNDNDETQKVIFGVSSGSKVTSLLAHPLLFYVLMHPDDIFTSVSCPAKQVLNRLPVITCLSIFKMFKYQSVYKFNILSFQCLFLIRSIWWIVEKITYLVEDFVLVQQSIAIISW